MTISGLQSATQAGYADIQRQQAKRTVEQASARADALAAAAASARKEANDAQRRADQLDIQAGEAETEANRVVMAASHAQGLEQLEKKMTLQFERLAEAIDASFGGGVFGKDGKLSPAAPTKIGQLIDVKS